MNTYKYEPTPILLGSLCGRVAQLQAVNMHS